MELVKKNEYKLLSSGKFKHHVLITSQEQKLEQLGKVTDEIQ